MESFEIKQKLLEFCRSYIKDRSNSLQHNLNSIEESLLSETKSSAGDKHETGRAMIQIEREKIAKQISQINNLSEIVSKIDIHKSSEKISLSSLVLTTDQNYFVSIGIGQILVDDNTYFAISPNSPIGLMLMGKSMGQEIKFREKVFKIEKIR